MNFNVSISVFDFVFFVFKKLKWTFRIDLKLISPPPCFLPLSPSLFVSVCIRLLRKKENMVLLPCLCFLFVKLDGWMGRQRQRRSYVVVGSSVYMALFPAIFRRQYRPSAFHPLLLFSFVIINLYYCCSMLCCVRQFLLLLWLCLVCLVAWRYGVGVGLALFHVIVSVCKSAYLNVC